MPSLHNILSFVTSPPIRILNWPHPRYLRKTAVKSFRETVRLSTSHRRHNRRPSIIHTYRRKDHRERVQRDEPSTNHPQHLCNFCHAGANWTTAKLRLTILSPTYANTQNVGIHRNSSIIYSIAQFNLTDLSAKDVWLHPKEAAKKGPNIKCNALLLGSLTDATFMIIGFYAFRWS